MVVVFSRSVVSNSFVTPCTAACQASLSMGFPTQEYWSGLPFLSPRDLPDPWIKCSSPAWQEGSLPLSNLGSPGWGLLRLIWLDPAHHWHLWMVVNVAWLQISQSVDRNQDVKEVFSIEARLLQGLLWTMCYILSSFQEWKQRMKFVYDDLSC